MSHDGRGAVGLGTRLARTCHAGAGCRRRWSPARPRRLRTPTGTTRSITAGSDAESTVRATSSRCGGRTHATSAPLRTRFPAGPRERLAREVRADRSEVLGRRHGVEPEVHPARRRRAAGLVAFGGLAGERAEHHPGRRDRREGVHRDAGRRGAAELPSERRDGALRAAVRTRIGRTPARSRRHADDATVPGRGHDRQRRPQHVEVAVEVDVEHRGPVILLARREAGRPADAGDVHDRVEGAELLDELVEERAHRGARR